MKQNLKKVLAILALTTSVAGLTACGSTSESDVTYDVAQFQSVADFLVANWSGMSSDIIAEYAALDTEDAADLLEAYGLPFTAEAFTTAFAGYEGAADELGAYVSTLGYDTPEVKGDEITFITHLEYENRTADLNIVFNKKSVAQSVTLNPDYSIGEILKKAGLNTLLGMGTVFAVLIFISLVIYCFNFIPAFLGLFSKKNETAPAPKTPEVKAVPVKAPEAEELVDDGELVAAITAAICAYRGTSSDGFVVRSIRRADSSTWKRA